MRYPLATASEVKLCPYCEEALPSPKPDSCPHCGRTLPQGKTKAAEFFECPDYLFFQKETLTALPDRKPKEGQEAARGRMLLAIHDDLVRFVRTSSPETLTAALFDAHLVMTHALHANLDGTTLKKIVATARAIGKMGEAIDQYIKAGGTTHDDGKTRETEQLFSAGRSDNWSETAAPDGRRPG